MPPNKPTLPDAAADYETAGADVLAAYTREKMSGSIARLKRDLRTAFSAKPKLQPPTTGPRRQG